MALPRVSLHSFLKSAKTALANVTQQSSPVTFVIGNESADLDSLCSAVVLAYLRTYTSTSNQNTLYIPLSNLPRADLSLRPELTPVLARSSLASSDLITLSDLPSIGQKASRIAPENTRWLLVDHNCLQGQLGEIYSTRVVGCIDHHDEENKVPQDCGKEPRIVKKSGSCASLVIEHCRDAFSSLSSKTPNGERKVWDAEIASLALAPILIDTTNLTRKLTSADTESAEYLNGLIKAQFEAFDSEEYFSEISTAKEDIGGLSVADILRKDYKQWTENSINLGVSSVVKDISFLLEKAEDKYKFLDAVKSHALARTLSVCSIMTTSHNDGVFRRELFVWGFDNKGIAAVKKFETNSNERLGLEDWHNRSLDVDDKDQLIRCWHQKDVESSRKQVGPLLRAAIEQVA